VNLVKGIFFKSGKIVVCNIENVLEMVKKLVMLHIPMIYTKPSSENMVRLFGNAGDQNLSLLINVTRLTAALMAIKLRIRFESILASHTPVMMRLALLL